MSSSSTSSHGHIPKVKLTRQQKKNCVQLFKSLDVDNSGHLDEHEVLAAMKAKGFDDYQLSDARTLIQEYDADGTSILKHCILFEIVFIKKPLK